MKDLADIQDIRDTTMCNIFPGEGAKTRVLVGLATCGIAAGARPVMSVMGEAIDALGLSGQVEVVQTGCIGICQYEPVVEILEHGKEKVTYVKMTEEKARRIAEEHLRDGRVVDEYTIGGSAGPHSLSGTDFYKAQERFALRNCGLIDPEQIDEYIARDGYMALAKVLREMSPDDVINELLSAGLRGRGGAGFPTGLKWKFAKSYEDDQKYVCCNADEGDPGAFMDRSVLEGDPHVVLEAMAIAGYTIGADQGYIYVRAEYPTAIKRLDIAINQAREYGMLGKDILGSGFDFDIELRFGAGAFVCGEETALMTSIEGKRGEPRPRPPFPAEKGLFNKPSILNNVETLANIPQIIINGAGWFSSIGTEKSKGTKVFALGGKIKNTGLVEVPMGTTLRQVIEEIGGGIPGGKKFKAAQTGGPSGGCIPAEHLDIPIDYDNLIGIGSMMGSGGMIVMDEDNCMVDIAKFFLEFTVDESCGKCPPCRIGTKRLYEMLEKIVSGNASEEDLDKIEELCHHIKDNALCGLGQTAPNPVLSTLHYFRDEYLAHVRDKKCPAGVCKELLSYEILPDKCIGCTVCAKNCPTGAINGELKKLHVVDQSKCIKCGACEEKCKFSAVVRR